MNLVDQFGRPLQSSHSLDPGYRGGWVTTSLGTPHAAPGNVYGVNRDFERKAARTAYFLNPLLYGAVSVIVNYVVGDSFSYGDMDDERAHAALDEFWAENDLGMLTERMATEWLIDGENATVFPRRGEGQRRDAPAAIGLLDVDRGLELETDPSNKVIGLKTDDGAARVVHYRQGEFIWMAHNRLWNDPRGWPVVMQAVKPALAYIGLMNHRIRIHEIQGRLNAVYYSLVDTMQPDGGLAQQQAKAAAYGRVPRDGSVVTLAKDATTGQSEELEFLTPGSGSGDAATDGRALRLLLAAALNIPEHYLGEGGNVTRTTADSMGDPARRGFLRRQATVRRWLDGCMKLDLFRRYGKEQEYTIKRVRYSDNGLTRVVENEQVTAERLEFPWVFPNVATDDLDSLVKKVELAADKRLASVQTLSGELGYDPALEAERMANEGSNGNWDGD